MPTTATAAPTPPRSLRPTYSAMLTGLAPGSTCATVRPERNAWLSIHPSRSTTSRCTQDCTLPPNVIAPRRTKAPSSWSSLTGRSGTSVSGGMARGRQLRQLSLISLFHPRRHPVLGQRFAEQLAYHWFFVGIIDLVAADPPADPCLRHALRVADGNHFMLEGQIPSRRRAGVEVLVKPEIGRNHHRPFLPDAGGGGHAFRPRCRVTLP